jgi:dTDP-4-dehydrorhamnose 3,5-epimerase
MELVATELPDVLVVRPTLRTDGRGAVRFVWDAPGWSAARLPATFVLENHLISHQWVLRGIHRQVTQPQGKLVRCLGGRVFDVAVDLRRGSPTFARWVGRELDAVTGEALWVPPGFGHGMLALTEGAVISIQASAAAVPGDERTLAWDDPTVAVCWPLAAGRRPILSARDQQGCAVGDFASPGTS